MKQTSLKFFNALLISSMLAMLSACMSSGRTSIETYSTDASADFSQLKTYRWDNTAMGKTLPDGGHLPEFDRVVSDHVDKILAEKGYKRVAGGAADFVLDYRIVVKEGEAAENPIVTPDAQSEANDYGFRWTFDKTEKPTFKGLQAPESQTVIYRQGTLHLAAYDKQGQTIWHSSATKIINEQSNEASRRAAIRVAVNKMMRTFPDD